MYGTQRELFGYEARGRIEKFAAIFSLVILGLTIFALGLSVYGLFDVDETRYAASALEMVRSGDYLIPAFNGEPRLDHPVLYYWFLSGFLHIFGFSPHSFRLVSALFAFITVMFIGHLVYHESRVEGGFLAGAILVTSSLFAYMGRVVMVEMVFATLVFFSSLFLYLGTFDSKNVNRTLIRAGLCTMALAVLTKGTAGWVLPFLSLVLFSWLNGRTKRMIDALLEWKGLVLFFLIVLPWYVAVYARLGPGLFNEVFIKKGIQNLLRITSSHREPIYYYIPVVLFGMFPWSFFLPQTVFAILKERGFSLKAVGENISLDMFLLLYSSVVFIYYSLSAAKLPMYILPLSPALSIVIALYLERVIVNDKYPDLGISAGAYAYAFASFLLGMFMIFPGEYFPIIVDADLQSIIFYPGVFLLVGAFIAIFFTIFRKKLKRVRVKIFATLLIAQLGFIWCIFFAVLPSVYHYRQMDLQEISLFINKRADENSSVVFYKKFKPSVTMFTGRKVQRAASFEEIVAYTTNRKKAFVIFPGIMPSVELTALGEVSEIYQGRLYSLFEVDMR